MLTAGSAVSNNGKILIMKIKILVAGCGSIGLRHITCLLTRKDVEISAFDLNKEAGQKVRELDDRIIFFSDCDAALEQVQPLITIVCTPNSSHKEMTLKAFCAGSHVLCEKPLADTVADGVEMVEAAKIHSRFLAVGYTERFRESFDYITKKIKSGELGNLTGGRAMVGTYNTLLCAKSDFRSKVFGILIVDYTHEIDMLRSIFGEVKDVVCKANSVAVKELKATPSLASLLLEYESGALVSIHMDYVQHPQRRIMEFFGDKQVIEYDLQTDQVKVYDCNKKGYEVIQFDNIRNERFCLEHQDIINSVLNGTVPRVDGNGAVEVLKIAETALSQIQNKII
jgi:predicted dehydrogenase